MAVLKDRDERKNFEQIRMDITNTNELDEAVKSDLADQKKWANSLFQHVDTKIEKIQDKIIQVKLAKSME